jgi:ABC-type sugar transport system ATPase subunit
MNAAMIRKVMEMHAPLQTEALLKVTGIEKSFALIQALRGVDMEIYTGEILAIVGDNGAGKTTLIKVLAGVLRPDRGEIIMDGKRFHYLTPRRAIGLGIATVYQDLALVDCRDVPANVFLGREPVWGIWVRKALMNGKTQKILDTLQINIPSLKTPVGLLSGGQRQGVAVARAIHQGGRVIIFDEPTAAMGVTETSKVLELMIRLRNTGYAVILVSHNLHQVFNISDRICVMRQGFAVGTVRTDTTTDEEVVRLITGSEGHGKKTGVGYA